MKKYMLIFVGIISLIGVSTVKADSLSLSGYYDYFDVSISYYSQYENQINTLISMWEEDYSESYPYYLVSLGFDSSSHSLLSIYLFYSESNTTYWMYSNPPTLYPTTYNTISYIISTNEYYDWSSSPYSPGASFLGVGVLINHGFVYNNLLSDSSVGNYDSILFPSFTSTNYNFTKSSFEIEEGDYLPGYVDLYNGSYIPNQYYGYTEINLNDYPYVVLSLKDYTIEEEFYSNMYVKGEYCVTPVYNYGLNEYSNFNDSRVPNICSPYYNDFTQIRMYVTKDNINNHAIYYLKAHDTTKENKVKIDASKFDIHYITQANEDNPILEIGGRSYSIIPYDELSSTAIKNTDDGYIPGNSCEIGDYNCSRVYYSVSDSNLFDASGGFNFSDIFTKPLEVLKGLWQAIATVFTLITSLISVLPPAMQYFLYLSFMLAIVLGLIKIIL